MYFCGSLSILEEKGIIGTNACRPPVDKYFIEAELAAIVAKCMMLSEVERGSLCQQINEKK